MYFVYILRSLIKKTFYIGQTKDILCRIEHHNSKNARWTKRNQPWELVYKEEYETRAEAMRREKQLKNLNRDKFLKLIHS